MDLPLIQILLLFVSSLIVYAVTRAFAFDRTPPTLTNPKRSSLFSFLGVFIGLLPFAIIFLLMSFSHGGQTSEAGGNEMQYTPRSVYNEIIFVLIAIAPSIIILRKQREGLDSVGISSKNFIKSLLLALVLIAFTIALASLLLGGGGAGVHYKFTTNTFWAFFYFALVASSEEFLFRGYLQTRLIAWLGTWKGWIIASLFMAITHIPQRLGVYGMTFSDAVLSSLSLIPISLFLGYVMLRTRNIAAPVLLHLFADWMNVFYR